MIDNFEKALRTIDPSVSLPYWDWTLDSQRPASSEIFKNEYFGGDGDPVSHCVNTGVAAGWTTTIPVAPTRPAPTCLRRCWTWGALYPPEAVTTLMNQASTFDALRLSIEGGPHGTVHIQGGGSCGDMSTMYSPNDPVFFLHHAMVDKIWHRWQSGCTAFQNLYDGVGVSHMDVMIPWGITVQDAMNTQGGNLCYTYSNSPGDLPLNLQCPNDLNFPNNTTMGNANSLSAFWFQEAIQMLVAKPMQNVTKRSLEDKPLPTYTPRSNLSIVAPKRKDFTDTIHLRHPTELTLEYIQMHRLDPYQVRSNEIKIKYLIDDLNNQRDYVSRAAIAQEIEWN